MTRSRLLSFSTFQ